MPAAVSDTRRAITALVLMALLGIALVFLFPGSPEQDTVYHFLMARTAWGNPSYFVGVWARPLYTTLFSLPDLLGFEAGRLFGVAIGVLTAWQTWRLACDFRLERAWLAIPLLLAQPVFFELYPDMLTEPLFGLIFVIAIRWHLRGWVKRAMLVASFLPLARPEGFFLGILWGVWVLAEAARGSSRPLLQRIVRALPSTLILASGTAVWWFAALCISGDPLYIPHNWPGTWHQDMYGRGSIFNYGERAWEFTGVFLAIPFLVGLWQTLPRRAWITLTSAFLLLFVLHTIFRLYGLFGEAGYPRYMVSVAAAIALITLQGWNTIAARIAAWPRGRTALAWSVLTLSLVQCFLYLDGFYWARDAIAIHEMAGWLRDHPVPHTRLIWSNARMCIDLGENFDTSPPLSTRGAATADLLRNAPSGTLVFWDDRIGPDWSGITTQEIEKCGYKILQDRHDSLPGVTGRDPAGRKAPPFKIEVTLLLKP
jgi:hypothetical protein